MKPMTQIAMITAAITLALASASSHAQGFGPRPGAFFPPAPGGFCPTGRLVQVPLNRYVQGFQNLPLRQILNLGPECHGASVEEVVLIAASRAGRGQARLVVNGQPEGFPQTLAPFPRGYSFGLHPRFNELGQNVRTLELQLQGQIFVQSIGVRLGYNRWPTPGGPGGYPGPGGGYPGHGHHGPDDGYPGPGGSYPGPGGNFPGPGGGPLPGPGGDDDGYPGSGGGWNQGPGDGQQQGPGPGGPQQGPGQQQPGGPYQDPNGPRQGPGGVNQGPGQGPRGPGGGGYPGGPRSF